MIGEGPGADADRALRPTAAPAPVPGSGGAPIRPGLLLRLAPPGPDPEADTRAATARVSEAWRAGYRLVVLDGPEPLSRPDLPRILRHAVRRGLATGVVTGGDRLAEPRVREGLVARANLRHATLRLAEHDGPADPLLAGAAAHLVAALTALGVEVRVEVALGPRRTSDPAALARAVAGLAAPVALVDGLPGAAAAPLEAVGRAAVAVARAVPAVDLSGLPRCLTQEAPPPPPAAAPPLDAWAAPVGPGDPSLLAEHVRPPACAGCLHHAACAGVRVARVQAGDDAALRPVRAAPSAGGGSLRGVPIAASADPAPFRPDEDARLDVSPRYPDTALVTLIVPGCDLSCLFCDTPQGDLPARPTTFAQVRASLRAMAGRADGVFLTGGEPTRLPWLDAALAHARDAGYRRVQMQSHAGPAADPARARALVEAGLTAIDVPLYGGDAATHEAITRTPGSFARTLGGLDNLRALGARSVVHATLFRSNLPGLTDLLRRLDAVGPDAAYLQVAGEVGPPGTYARVAPPPAEVGVALVAAFAAFTPRTPVHVVDVPPCLLPGLEDRVLRWQGPPERGASPVVLPYSEWLMVFSAGATRAHGAACASCGLRARCDGLPREALATFGEAALRPR